MSVYGNSRPQFTDINGNPIQGGKLYIGLPDQDPVANPNPTVTDMDGNPIGAVLTLDDVGCTTIPFKVEGDFSQRVDDSAGEEVPSYQQTRVGGFLQESDLVGVSGQGGDWNAGITYGKDDLVKGSDGKYYKSLTGSNLNNDPTSVTTSWSRLAWPTIYNANEAYDIGDSCLAENGLTYISVVNGNTGNQPLEDDGTNWTRTRGCFIYNSAATQSIPNITGTLLDFDTEFYDTSDFHDNAVSNQAIFIPANVSRARLTAKVFFDSSAAGLFSAFIEKNATDIVAGDNKEYSAASFPKYINMDTGVIDVLAGDFFTVEVQQSSGAPLDVVTGGGYPATWFTLEVIA